MNRRTEKWESSVDSVPAVKEGAGNGSGSESGSDWDRLYLLSKYKTIEFLLSFLEYPSTIGHDPAPHWLRCFCICITNCM